MIKIDIFRNGDGMVSGYHVSGHSGTADRGEYIICAGVSALVQSAFMGVREHLHRGMRFEQASGDFTVELNSRPDELTEAIFASMLLGLREIEKLSPEAVRRSEFRG